MPLQAATGSHRLLPMTVDNIGFLLDRLGQDCHPLQFVRELTKNSIEAIQRTKSDGQIIWDFEPVAFDLEGVRRLCIVDNGDGMTGDEMVKFINQLSSSLSRQSLHGNYGVGAKIAAATRNPAGVSYYSWKDGKGAMIRLHKDELTGQYGLQQWERSDGSFAHYLPIEDDLKPEIINDHGTMVVLHGKNPTDNTLLAPAGVPAPKRWITRYLNTRYFRIPANIQISCREGNLLVPSSADDIGTRRGILGQGEYLQRYGSISGSITLSGAIAHWWIIRERDEDKTDPIEKYSGHLESKGHVAALYQDELYEITAGRSGMSRLQQFGVMFGYERVVIYVEPAVHPQLMPNTARTSLLVGNEPLPWPEWAAEFREKLPIELKNFVEARAPGPSSADHVKTIRDRIKAIMSLYKVSRYRVAADGRLNIDAEQMVRGGKPATGGTRSVREASTVREERTPGGREGNLYALFERKDGPSGEKVEPDMFPKVDWVSVDDATRAPEYIEDRAAKYLVDQNRLLVNADFRVFRDMIEHFMQTYQGVAVAEKTVKDTVHTWFEQNLIEAVIGVQALRNSKQWSAADIEDALSEEALTACVMQRYHIYLSAKRELGSKIGSAKQAAA